METGPWKLCSVVLILSLLNNAEQFLLDSSIETTSRCPTTVADSKYLHVFRDRCFEFVIYHTKYWSDARHDCLDKGGDLVVIPDAETQDFIMTSLRNLGNTHAGIWLGLTDLRHELHWEWVNGEPLTGYNHWAHRQGGANALHYTQDCAQIRTDDHGLWHDRECHLWPNRFSYICEFEMIPIPPTTISKSASTTLSKTTTTNTPSTTTPATSTAAATSTTTTTSTTPSTTTSATTSLETTIRMSTTKIPEAVSMLAQIIATKTTSLQSTLTLNVTKRTSDEPNTNTTLTNRPNTSLTSLKSSDLKSSESSIFLAVISSTGTLSSDSRTTHRTDYALNGTVLPQSTTTALPTNSTKNVTHAPVYRTETPTSATEVISETPETRLTTGSLHLASTLPVKTHSTTKKHECTFVDCDTRCPHGYSGLFVGADGCVQCGCL